MEGGGRGEQAKKKTEKIEKPENPKKRGSGLFTSPPSQNSQKKKERKYKKEINEGVYIFTSLPFFFFPSFLLCLSFFQLFFLGQTISWSSFLFLFSLLSPSFPFSFLFLPFRGKKIKKKEKGESFSATENHHIIFFSRFSVFFFPTALFSLFFLNYQVLYLPPFPIGQG
jgi:hypothetical protein